MLEIIYSELGKLIARDIYDAAKRTPALVESLKKDTALRANGNGLPEAVLQQFDSSFAQAMRYASSDGFAKWRGGNADVRFNFYMTQKIIDKIQKVDWAAAAKRTADGVKQVTLLGGNGAYNDLINGLVPRMVARAIAASKGTYYGDGRGRRVLTPSDSVQVAHNGKTDFAPHDIFYMSEGTKSETAHIFKRAKKLLLPGWFGKKPPAPFEGPYFN